MDIKIYLNQIELLDKHARFCIVEPYGDFVADPDGDITEIKLIDPWDYKKYFDWGIIGEHIMKRAMDMKKEKDLLQ